MNKILMICYYFPPLSDVGAKRSIAFSKYFLKNGYRPYVISVKNPDQHYCKTGHDVPPQGVETHYSYSLINLAKISSIFNGIFNKIAEKIKNKNPINYFEQLLCIPDFFWGWIPLTTLKAYKIIKKENINIIYVSCTPYSSAIIGFLLKKITGKKLIIDFRDRTGVEDPDFGVKRFPVKLRLLIEKFWLRKVLKFADIFSVTSYEIKEGFTTTYPFLKEKIHSIYNGFDKDFFPTDLENLRKNKNDKFTIIYTGDFYEYYLKSSVFFESLAILKSENKINNNNFEFKFYGDSWKTINGYAENFDVADLVTAQDRIPYKEVILEILKAHVQLIRIIKPAISTKVFEGISLNIPFLAIIPSGEVSKMITEFSPSSKVVTNDSALSAAKAIERLIFNYENDNITDNYVERFLKLYSRENQTIKFMSIIEKLKS